MKQDGGEGSGDELETGVLKKRESSTRTSYLDQKLVEMGTDRIQRKQARLSKRTIAPERRTANQIMNQIRKVRRETRVITATTSRLDICCCCCVVVVVVVCLFLLHFPRHEARSSRI